MYVKLPITEKDLIIILPAHGWRYITGRMFLSYSKDGDEITITDDMFVYYPENGAILKYSNAEALLDYIGISY